ncbi:hypothetical protein BGW39_010370 [Mortierella sp. 14UC]|nr:hypothetical protein BGW39_010370 [Mortierella sp. 14UC]
MPSLTRGKVQLRQHAASAIPSQLSRPDITITILCQELNDHFNFSPPISTATVSRAVRDKAGYTLKLLRQEPADYNNPERLQARQVWTQEFLESAASMMNAVFVDEAGFNLHLVRRFGRHPGDEGQS